MLVQMLKSKIHSARVTDLSLEYEGSLTVDREILDRVGILTHEKILVANLRNGERFETYAIPGKAGERQICLNGAAAHKGELGDRLIVFAFCQLDTAEARAHRPVIVHLNEKNDPID